jgi:hypothetical protein
MDSILGLYYVKSGAGFVSLEIYAHILITTELPTQNSWFVRVLPKENSILHPAKNLTVTTL